MSGTERFFEPMLSLLVALQSNSGADEVTQLTCCNYHKVLQRRVLESFKCAEPKSVSAQKQLFLDLIGFACVEIDRHHVHETLYSSTAARPEIENYSKLSAAGTIRITRLIPLSTFVTNYMPQRPKGQGAYKSGHSGQLSSFGEWLADAAHHKRTTYNRRTLLRTSKYGAPRGFWGAHIDKSSSPGFASYCRHATAFCVIQGSISGLIVYDQARDLSGLFDELGVPPSQRSGHYIEAIYDVPPYSRERRSGLRTPGFMDAGGYPQWRPQGQTLAIGSNAAHGKGKIRIGSLTNQDRP